MRDTYKVTIGVMVGGYEKYIPTIIQADSENLAGTIAIWLNAHGELEFFNDNQQSAQDSHGGFLYRVTRATKIDKRYLSAILKYYPVYTEADIGNV